MENCILDWSEEIKACGSIRATARKHEVPYSTLCGWIKSGKGLPDGLVKARENETPGCVIPEGYRAKGTSTLYDEFGNPKLQWVKTQIDPDALREMMRAASEEFSRTIEPSTVTKDVRLYGDENLLTVYVLSDIHAGMLSWRAETGADWDTAIAEQTIDAYFRHAVAMSPPSEQAVLANLGDALHFDGMMPVTPASRHVLDADTRFQKLVRVIIRSFRRAISEMLTKHKTVRVIMGRGNHDESASAWLRECFSVFYENEPRVTVDTSPDPYYAVEHGNTAVFFHHGDKRRVKDVDTVFVAKFRSLYGRTKYAYGHIGHLHSIESKETGLMVVERHRTLAAPDAYASYGGWMSGRSACSITYDRRYGETTRVTVPYEMLRDAS